MHVPSGTSVLPLQKLPTDGDIFLLEIVIVASLLYTKLTA
jgi:hypothetical protein